MQRSTRYCPCLQCGPYHKSEVQIGVDKWCDEIALQVCLQCKRRWLYYFIEHQGFSSSGRQFLGVLPDDVRLPINPNDAVEIFSRMPWYFYGGSYWGGGWSKCSGKLPIGLTDTVENRLTDGFVGSGVDSVATGRDVSDVDDSVANSGSVQSGNVQLPDAAIEALNEIRKRVCDGVKRGNTPLVTRIVDTHPWLLDERSEDEEGGTLLHVAANWNRLEVARFLLAKSVDPDIRSGVDEGDGDYYPGYTPLMVAAEEGALAVARLLIESGADIDATAANGQTPLWFATNASKHYAMAYLLENGADPEIQAGSHNISQALGSYWMGTPLHTAARRGDLDAVECLLSYGALVESEAPPGVTTPLHHASAHGSADVVSALLRAGADVNREQDLSTVGEPDYKYKAIHFAAKGGCVGILDVLVKNGADPKAVAAGYDVRSIDLAREYGHDDAVEYLEEFTKTWSDYEDL